jgi:hypothetical protein
MDAISAGNEDCVRKKYSTYTAVMNSSVAKKRTHTAARPAALVMAPEMPSCNDLRISVVALVMNIHANSASTVSRAMGSSPICIDMATARHERNPVIYSGEPSMPAIKDAIVCSPHVTGNQYTGCVEALAPTRWNW